MTTDGAAAIESLANPSDIDEEAWSSMYSTVSRPFVKPETGKIAVKVINDFGDEVLQVFSV
jgi:adenine-specific DNA-methyltransferase